MRRGTQGFLDFLRRCVRASDRGRRREAIRLSEIATKFAIAEANTAMLIVAKSFHSMILAEGGEDERALANATWVLGQLDKMATVGDDQLAEMARTQLATSFARWV